MFKPKLVKLIWLILWPLLWLVCKVLFKIEVQGLANIKNIKIPMLAFANHTSYADGFLIAAATPVNSIIFPIFWLGKPEIFRVCKGFFALPARLLGVFPIKNGGGLKTTLATISKLSSQGWSVGIFPEGQRVEGNSIGKFNRGTAYFALKLGLPLMPIAIVGAHEITLNKIILGKIKIKVIFGQPFEIADNFHVYKDENIQAINSTMKTKLENLASS